MLVARATLQESWNVTVLWSFSLLSNSNLDAYAGPIGFSNNEFSLNLKHLCYLKI